MHPFMSGRPLAIGLGCNSTASIEAIVTLVKEALAQIEAKDSDLPTGLYTMEEKRSQPALMDAAARLALPLIYLPLAELKAVASRAITQSPIVYALYGVPSIAETAALVGAGPDSELLAPRISADGVTCAIASIRANS